MKVLDRSRSPPATVTKPVLLPAASGAAANGADPG